LSIKNIEQNWYREDNLTLLEDLMTTQQFIFSNDRKHRLIRHLSFWGAYCMLAFYAEFQNPGLHELKLWKTYKSPLLFLGLFLPMSIFMVYIFIYVLIPKFIQTKRYFRFTFAASGVLLFCLAVNMIPGYLFHFDWPYPPATEEGVHWLYFEIDYQHTLHEGICLAAAVTCIKLAKAWYLQQTENTRLAQLDAENRTKLFKSQIQPEFLFHSLQTLNKKIQTSPDEAPGMVINLSDIFSYILYDCNEKYILLEKELLAIQNFVITENMNEENTAKINMKIRGDSRDKLIAPLTLFSFLEKQIVPIMDPQAGERSIDIDIDIKDSTLTLIIRLKNQGASPVQNIQAYSLHKKLQFNIPDNFIAHHFSADKSGNAFIIDATIELVGTNNIEHLQYQSIDLN